MLLFCKLVDETQMTAPREYTDAFIITKKLFLGGLRGRVSVQGVKSLGGHFACLCRGFEFYEVKKNYYYF